MVAGGRVPTKSRTTPPEYRPRKPPTPQGSQNHHWLLTAASHNVRMRHAHTVRAVAVVRVAPHFSAVPSAPRAFPLPWERVSTIQVLPLKP